MIAPPLWRLDARPESLIRACLAWRDLARAARALALRTDPAAAALLRAWDGESALAYDAHRRRISAAIADVSTVADDIAGLLEHAAGLARHTQSHLDDSWRMLHRRLAALGHRGEVDGAAAPLDQAHRTLVRAAEAEATGLRERADAGMAELTGPMTGAEARIRSRAAAVDRPSAEQVPWLDLPERSSAGAVIRTGGRAIVNATGGDDVIQVGLDPVTGEQVVRIGDTVTRIPAEVALVVRAGAGNDTITVAPGCAVRLTLLGGAGDDAITGGSGADTILGLWGRDRLAGGAGADRLSGGTGRDYLDGQFGDDLVYGGDGDDTLYGLDGRDRLSGGDGRDYLDGGAGADRIDGGPGNDVLMGGRGDDDVRGGGGDDAMYAGAGRDTVRGGGDHDTAYAQSDDAVAGVARSVTVELTDISGDIRVEGTLDFVARVQSDLDALRSSPRGREMLAALAATQQDSAGAGLPIIGGLFQGDTLVIRGTSAANGFTEPGDAPIGSVAETVRYNPSFDSLAPGTPTPPVVVLYHELAHVYDAYYGTAAGGIYTGADNPGVNNLEREATGLPIDADDDPATPDELDPDHPYGLTENGLREEMGLNARPWY